MKIVDFLKEYGRMRIVLFEFLRAASSSAGFSLRGFPSRSDYYYYYLSSVILSDGRRIKVNEIVGQHNLPGRDLRDWLMTVYWRPPVIHQWQMINSPPRPAILYSWTARNRPLFINFYLIWNKYLNVYVH